MSLAHPSWAGKNKYKKNKPNWSDGIDKCNDFLSKSKSESGSNSYSGSGSKYSGYYPTGTTYDSSKYKEEREKREAKEKAEKEARAKEEESKRLVLISDTLNQLKDSNQNIDTQQIRDLINLARMKMALNGFDAPKSISLLLGDNSDIATASEISRAHDLAQFALDQGYFVVYDADSSVAPHIAKTVGSFGLGISAGNSHTPDHVIVIKNPYIRMQALGIPTIVSISDESVSGLGLVFNNMATHHTSSALGSKTDIDFHKLEPKFSETNYGISFKKINWLTLTKSELKNIQLKTPEEILTSMSYSELTSLPSSQFKMTEATKYMNEHQSADGAIIFGSGRMPGKYIQPVYQVVHYLAEQGMPIFTGGAGGVMQVANQAAFDAGVESVGIGLGGKLKSERESMSDIHTLTLEVSDYSERIPLLLQDRKVVIIAPGGGGTMKELATTLVAEAGEKNSNRIIVLVGKSYYQNIYDLLAQTLPPSIAGNLYLIDNKTEMAEILRHYKDNIWSDSDIKSVFRDASPTPRNNNTDFKEPYSYTPKYNPAWSSFKKFIYSDEPAPNNAADDDDDLDEGS